MANIHKSEPVSESESLAKKFGLSPQELYHKTVHCTYKAKLKLVGQMHIFQDHICFESTVFASNFKVSLLLILCSFESRKSFL